MEILYKSYNITPALKISQDTIYLANSESCSMISRATKPCVPRFGYIGIRN